ncbi:MAG TPA: MFS transporter, partial [Gemmataceae bacterium]|nr:MFS transporter [Gemmataceae bacterium]
MGEDSHSGSAGSVPRESARRSGGNFRWVICALLFFATTVNYIDRNVLGVLAPELKETIGWTDTQYGDINAAFQFAYAVGFLVVGRFIDLVGARLGYAVSLIVWSLIAAGHALARTPLQFGLARFLLGFAEAGNFPAAIKATAEWFPRRERALATGIFNAGTNVGATIAPLLVPLLAVWWGWQSAFVVTGVAGLAWVIFWLPVYDQPDRHPRVTAEELAWIRSDPPEPAARVPWLSLLPLRQTWAVAVGKFLTDPIWWFYLFWLPDFLGKQYHLKGTAIALPVAAVYILSS